MKKIFLNLTTMLLLGMPLVFVACDDDTQEEKEFDRAANIDYNQENREQWANYMSVVSNLLKIDATTLYNDWATSFNGGVGYGTLFKNHDNEDYGSAINCIETILDGCADIASEVGSAKIGDPYNLYVSGRKAEALYAVESWYSWHSRDDYSNNIRSIRNAYFGSRDGKVSAHSLSAALEAKNKQLDAEAKARIQAAIDAILDIPQPFRNNINSAESKKAMEACSELEDFITNSLKPYFQKHINDAHTLNPIIDQYVDAVVIPTYKDLMDKNIALDNTVKAFKKSPSDAAFEACAKAWLEAREPWESSEAFLFGPVADKGLDPNMDSWPLDQERIVKILKSQDFTDLEWSGDYDEESEEIAAHQEVRGFHTLEFLIFKDGQARKIQK